MTPDLTDVSGDFYRINMDTYFIDSSVGSFVWNVVEQQLVMYYGSYFGYLNDNKLIRGKYFGRHRILEYCNPAVVVDKVQRST